MTGTGASASREAARWIYGGVWRIVVGWLRVPETPPELPVGPREQADAFGPADAFLRYLKLWFWIVALIVDVALVVLWFVLLIVEWWVALLVLPLAVLLIVVPDVIIYVALHLRFDTTWYVMTERSLRIRRGVWIIREMTVTFENVQNLKVHQGPVQRLYGVSSLLVETAGGSSSTEGHSKGLDVGNQAVIEGIANARELRDRILGRLRMVQSAGLGDEAEDAAAGWSPEHVAALREIRDAVRGLPGRVS
ncbi:MAG: PH domain-containing protein [Planctomycetes bacterium]|nr:PH domain-containing protein [Planctomycetota bacterium]